MLSRVTFTHPRDQETGKEEKMAPGLTADKRGVR